MQITVGADPEVFLVNPAGNFVSSVGRIGGSKDMPLPIGNGCAIQEDNVTVEFNIPPAKTVEAFLESMEYNLEYLSFLAESQGLGLSVIPSATFSDEELDSYGAQTFGCEPDFNAWKGGERNPRPRSANKNLRSCGGHIHIGGIESLDKLEVIKAMDLYVGTQMVLFDQDVDRRTLYGKAGAFRPKDYGVEYRTASNAWVKSKELQSWVYHQTQKAVDFVAGGGTVTDELGVKIQQCINTSDVALAKELAGLCI